MAQAEPGSRYSPSAIDSSSAIIVPGTRHIIIRFANATLPLPSCNDAAFIVAGALANAGLRLILANASRPHICALDEIFALKESRTTTCHYQCGTTEDTLQQRNEVTHDARQAAAPRDGHAPDVAPNHPIPPTYKIPDEHESIWQAGEASESSFADRCEHIQYTARATIGVTPNITEHGQFSLGMRPEARPVNSGILFLGTAESRWLLPTDYSIKRTHVSNPVKSGHAERGREVASKSTASARPQCTLPLDYDANRSVISSVISDVGAGWGHSRNRNTAYMQCEHPESTGTQLAESTTPSAAKVPTTATCPVPDGAPGARPRASAIRTLSDNSSDEASSSKSKVRISMGRNGRTSKAKGAKAGGTRSQFEACDESLSKALQDLYDEEANELVAQSTWAP
ncbi:hypothetical protein BU15DRAFT_66352 [Melanogaster broomeanus]|nr:hypothetical protein BU15DRAFT_66352 [Melanogaster broomeanus]